MTVEDVEELGFEEGASEGVELAPAESLISRVDVPLGDSEPYAPRSSSRRRVGGWESTGETPLARTTSVSAAAGRILSNYLRYYLSILMN
jgi:hypothetical protein